HPKYKGRRVFGAGINLTHLYHGRIPFVWYLQRDLGYVNKIYRGLAFADDAPPDEFGGKNLEKPWIAAGGSFALRGPRPGFLVVGLFVAPRRAIPEVPPPHGRINPRGAHKRHAP